MKRGLFLITSLVVLISCSVKTNEEKARDIIEPQVKANLIKPNSYEFGQVKLDSCFSDDNQRNPKAITFALKVAKLFKKYKEYMDDAESAESSMTIYAPSFGYQDAHSKQQQRKYRAEMERAQQKAAAAKEEILKLYKDNEQLFQDIYAGKHEFVGWCAIFDYRAETAGGLKTIGGGLFFLNKDLTEITHSFTEEDMLDMQSVDLDDLKYEFEEDFKGLFDN